MAAPPIEDREIRTKSRISILAVFFFLRLRLIRHAMHNPLGNSFKFQSVGTGHPPEVDFSELVFRIHLAEDRGRGLKHPDIRPGFRSPVKFRLSLGISPYLLIRRMT